MIMSLFKKDPSDEIARILYNAVVEQARKPEFYANFEAPDSVEGRFELLTLHVYLLLRRLRGANAKTDKLAQKVFDTFFQNMDDSLREMGVGDMSIGRKIRAMAESFYGRAAVYEKALQPGAGVEDATGVLEEALSRNVYALAHAPGAIDLAKYVRRADTSLKHQSIENIQAGNIDFPTPGALANDEKSP